jgi:monothiol glutaredoxin
LGWISEFNRPLWRASPERLALVELHSVGRAPDESENAMEIVDRIKSTLTQHPIVLFMKGTPQFPMCGFSSRTAQALKAVNADYFSVNVLEDPEIRANLPRYSNWPTFPQLFIHGELIGGCDITMELYESGELDRLVKDAQKS